MGWCWAAVPLLWLGAVRLRARTGLGPAAAHLCWLLCGVLGLSAAGLFNLLLPAAWLYFALPLAWAVRDIRRLGGRAWVAQLRAFADVPLLLYLLAAAALTAVYVVQDPVFTYWDEFYIWGINAKVMSHTDLLYTVGQHSAGVYYPCGAPMLSYLFQFFAPAFTEAGMLLAYALFYFAVFAAAAELVGQAPGGRPAAVLLFVALALSPFLEAYHGFTEDLVYISYGYATSMADLLLGVAMFCGIVLYLAAPQKRWYLAGLAVTALIKETGVLPAVLAGLLISVWQLLRPGRPDKAALRRWLPTAAGNLVAPALTYLIWLIYTVLVAGSRPTTPLPGLVLLALLTAAALCWRRAGADRRERAQNAVRRFARLALRRGLPVLVLAGAAAVLWLLLAHGQSVPAQRLKALIRLCAGPLVPALRNEYWDRTMAIMAQDFFTTRTLFLGPDAAVAGVLLALTAAAALLCRNRAGAVLLLLSQAMLALGAVLYLYVHSYFVADFLRTMGMVEYGRYFSSYLYAWVFTAALLILLAPRRPLGGQALALGMAAAVAGTVLGRVGWEHTIVATPDVYRAATDEWLDLTAECRRTLHDGDRVYLVFPNLDTGGYLRTVYYLYPALVGQAKVDTDVDYSVIFCAAADPNDPYSPQYNIADADSFADMLRRNFDYAFVIGDSGNYARDYWDVFESGIYKGMLYRICPDEKKPAVPMDQFGG